MYVCMSAGRRRRGGDARLQGRVCRTNCGRGERGAEGTWRFTTSTPAAQPRDHDGRISPTKERGGPQWQSQGRTASELYRREKEEEGASQDRQQDERRRSAVQAIGGCDKAMPYTDSRRHWRPVRGRPRGAGALPELVHV